MNGAGKKTVAVCENQPVTAEGLRTLIRLSPDLDFVAGVPSLPAALDLVRQTPPDVLVIDKAFGTNAILEFLEALKPGRTAPVVWGIAMMEPEVLRFVQAGARGVIRKSSDLESLLDCLRAVASGRTWMEQTFRPRLRRERAGRSGLTVREQQVVELVGQGLKNREIGSELGIRPGTVKVHLKHIFEKTGVRGRFGLALAEFEE